MKYKKEEFTLLIMKITLLATIPVLNQGKLIFHFQFPVHIYLLNFPGETAETVEILEFTVRRKREKVKREDQKKLTWAR